MPSRCSWHRHGDILAHLQQAAAEADRLFPLSLGAEGSCQIGDNLSTSAGGIAAVRYGNTRELTLGLEVVLADGRVWDGLRGLRKHNTGYDLKQLFIGGEGTLGIITAATMKLFPTPREVETAFLGLSRVEDVMGLFGRARAAIADQLTAFELITRAALDLALAHVPVPRIRSRLVSAARNVVEPDRERRPRAVGKAARSGPRRGSGRRWGHRRKQDAGKGALAYSRGHCRSAALFGLDQARRLDAGQPGCGVHHPRHRRGDANAARHPADGLRPGRRRQHPLQRADTEACLARWQEFNDIVHGVVRELQGSISAERGVGMMKRDEITHYKSPVEIELMRRLKRAFDPANIMNPGKVVSV
jgi:D-lactate dehydrogenase (cytochrome)